ncbi:hypothetical protein M1S95_21440, partial [Providencia rettgeri]
NKLIEILYNITILQHDARANLMNTVERLELRIPLKQQKIKYIKIRSIMTVVISPIIGINTFNPKSFKRIV